MFAAWFLSLFTLASCAYLLLTLWVVRGFAEERRRARERRGSAPSEAEADISQIKPVHDLRSTQNWECLRTFADQNYGGLNQMILAASSQDVFVNEAGQSPAGLGSNVETSCASAEGLNLKIASCIPAVSKAAHEILVFSDADMIAPPELLRSINEKFRDDKVGLVTCLYIVKKMESAGAVFEGVSVADFCASVLVARLVEGIRFALGAVMALKKETLQKIGGLEAIKDYLADDYQLGFRTSQLGLEVVLAPEVVEDVVDAVSFKEYFLHQLRWMRTYRVSRPGGFFSFFITQGLFWSLAALCCSGLALWAWMAFFIWLILRLAASVYVWNVLAEDKKVVKYALLAPVKDIFYVIMWFSAFFGQSRVQWGKNAYNVKKDGKLELL
ncbi:glycosyltransferase [bacterium]|nr:glycosyltransferase [bacterium]